jgi:hypothetical protein
MTDRYAAPLVYGSHGEVLGVDYRRTALVPDELRVPGIVPARAVMPGDTVLVRGGERRVVVRVEALAESASRRLHLLDSEDRPVVELLDAQMVSVVEVGFFEPWEVPGV